MFSIVSLLSHEASSMFCEGKPPCPVGRNNSQSAAFSFSWLGEKISDFSIFPKKCCDLFVRSYILVLVHLLMNVY